MEEPPPQQRTSGRVRIPVQMNDYIEDTPPEAREVDERPKRKAIPSKHIQDYRGNLRQSQSPVLRRQKKAKTPAQVVANA